MLPWWLYALTPRDQSLPTLRIWNQYGEAFLNNVALTVSFTVPLEYIAVLHNWSAHLVAGAGQVPIRADLEFTKGASSQLLFKASSTTFSGGVTVDSAGQLALNGMLVPPETIITFRGTFNAAANFNTLRVGLGATLIPRGTVQVL